MLTAHEPSAPTATVLRKTNGTEIPAVNKAGIAHNFFKGLHTRRQVQLRPIKHCAQHSLSQHSNAVDALPPRFGIHS